MTRVNSGITTAVGMLSLKLHSGKWNCDICRSERLRVLEEKLRLAHVQIEKLTRRNKALGEQFRLAEKGNDVEEGHGDGKAQKRSV